MAKIHITGNSGSGKTTLADQLGRRLDLPVFGLDRVVWQSGWKITPQDLRIELELELASKPNWIIEGVSPRIRQAADTVIFLDVGRWTSIKRALLRNMKYLFKGRPELPSNCPEILAIPQQIRIIWQFKERTKPAILDGLRNHDGQVFIVRTPDQLAEALDWIISENN